MKITFVIPAYNEERYLSDCLSSIISQAHNALAEVEIVVVNNASTDRTKEVAQSFSGVIVVDEPKKGITHARQAGFLRADGEIIAHIDADSKLAPGWINYVHEQFSKRADLIALSGPVIYNDLPIVPNLIIRTVYYAAFLSYLFTKYVFRVGSFVQGSNSAVKKSALEKIGGYNTAVAFYGEDSELARRLHPLGPVVFTFKLPVYTSGRRFEKEGLAKIGWTYILNYFSAIFLKKPWTADYSDIRLDKPKNESTNLNRLNNFLMGLKFIFAALIFAALFAFFRSPFQTTVVAEAHAMSKIHIHGRATEDFRHAWTTTQKDFQKVDFDRDKNL